MSKHLLVAAIVAGLATSVTQLANAADQDMPYKAAAPAWNSCYIGVQGGLGGLQDGYTGSVNPAVVNPAIGLPVANVQNQWGFGVLAGGQVGCNWQFGRFVAGIESDAWGSSLKSVSNLVTLGDAAKASTTNPWDVDLTGRVGFAFDQILFYTKAGAAWGSFKYNFTSFAAGQSGSSISPGFLWGLGFEYALGSQWSLKAETNFIYFSSSNVNIACTGCVGPNATQSSISNTELLFKVGANFKLN